MARLIDHAFIVGRERAGMSAPIGRLLALLVQFLCGHRFARSRFARTVVLCIGLSAAGCYSAAQAAPSDGGAATVEQRVKAASLYKFLGYVEWPPASFATPGSPYVIGVVGADDIADELSRISAGRSVNNKALSVKRLKAGESLAGIHVLFIGREEGSRQAQLLQSAQKQPVLTVTETEGALAQGSMINFRLADERVRFEVSLDAIEKSDVRVSSRMLAVALFVSRGVRQ
jgi:hypothetical protein